MAGPQHHRITASLKPAHSLSNNPSFCLSTMANPLNPYAALYEHPKGPGDQRPTAIRVIQDNNVAGKWRGNVILVTGGTSGIGAATVQALHETGADVYFTARDMGKGVQLAEKVRGQSSGAGKIEAIFMCLDSLESVKVAASTLLNLSGGRLNVLINNAGRSSISGMVGSCSR